MFDADSLSQQWLAVVDQLAQLGPMHAGSICRQTNRVRTKDGRQVLRGPYTILTFKRKGKTVTRHLPTHEAVERSRRQIENFQLFQSLVAQLVDLGQQRAISEPAQAKKNSTPRSRPSKRPRRRG